MRRLLLLAVVFAACSEEPVWPRGALFHKAETSDAHSREFLSDGGIRWVSNGCDYYLSGRSGGWRRVDGGYELSSADGVTFGADDGDGGFVVTFRDGDGGVATREHWVPGGICPTCGGGLGPTGAGTPCDPFLDAG